VAGREANQSALFDELSSTNHAAPTLKSIVFPIGKVFFDSAVKQLRISQRPTCGQLVLSKF